MPGHVARAVLGRAVEQERRPDPGAGRDDEGCPRPRARPQPVLAQRMRVHTDNDVHAHALGEHWLGACAGTRTALVVAAGTGVGATLLLDGTPQHGARHVAGHLGHLPAAEAASQEPGACGGTRCPPRSRPSSCPRSTACPS